MTNTTIEDKAMQAMLKFAQDVAISNNLNFDYAEKTIVDVDVILEQARQEVKATAPGELRDSGIEGVSLCLGAYIAEVTDRVYGRGGWSKETAVEGDSTSKIYVYTNQGVSVSPVEWCRQRLTSDDTEKVAELYQRFVSKLVKKKSRLSSLFNRKTNV